MMRVLLATDGSADARTAAQWLADFPLPVDTTVLVVTVVNLPPSPIDIPTVAEFKSALLEAAGTAAEELIPVLKGHVAAVETRVVEGDARQKLIELAKEWSADLMVVGARGLGAVATALLGSVSIAVVRHAPCAVMVVRPSPRPLRSAIVALDGSEHSLEAARFLGRLPLPSGLAVRLVGVVEPPAMPRTVPSAAREMLRAAASRITDDRRRALDTTIDAAGKYFRASNRMLPIGAPGEILERLSAETDLVVVGARGLGAFKRALLGSVSERLVRHAGCTVLVVHER
jgi:nucleotide-binding universal stress UspA family protein